MPQEFDDTTEKPEFSAKFAVMMSKTRQCEIKGKYFENMPLDFEEMMISEENVEFLVILGDNFEELLLISKF